MDSLSTKALCQLEFHSLKLDASLEFFRLALGWSPLPMALHEYVVLEVPSDSPYGISLLAAQEKRAPAQALIPYFRWDALETLMEKIQLAGGKIISGPRHVPAYGRTLIIEEPGGIQLGFFAALQP